MLYEWDSETGEVTGEVPASICPKSGKLLERVTARFINADYLQMKAQLKDNECLAVKDGVLTICPDYRGTKYFFRNQWPSFNLPDNTWMERDGSILSIADYPELFLILGNQYGGEAGSTFALPDDRGLVERGWDHGRGFDAGRDFGNYQPDAIRNIHGELYYAILRKPNETPPTGAFYASWYGNESFIGDSAMDYSEAPTNIGFDTSRVVPTAAENRMKNRAYLPIIKVA